MSAPNLQQRAAITARGNVLVAAGAGTGKTRTIVERCRQLVFGEGCPLDRILMVTFTEAAAAEMRERIREALRQELGEQKQTPGSAGVSPASYVNSLSAAGETPALPGAVADTRFDSRRHLEEQLALLDSAPISTLHSFCLDLVRRHFYQLGLDPQFTVLDEQQTAPLIRQVLDELLQRHYAVAAGVTRRNVTSSENPPPHLGGYSVPELVRSYGRGSDEPIRKLVVQIHRHTQALASPGRWFAEQVANFSEASPASWRQAFVEGVAEWAALWREVLSAFTAESRNVAASAAALASLSSQPSFDEAAKAVAAVVAADAVDWRGTKGKFRDPIKLFFTDAAFLHELSRNGGEAMTQDWTWMRVPMLALLELAREFTDSFTLAKRELGGIDFADQEQLALRLLYEDAIHPLPSSDEGRGQGEGSALGEPQLREHPKLTPVALACRERFRFVFVDECQDINAAQDAILCAVSRPPRERAGHRTETQHLPDLSRGEGAEANRFLVGDVKQSIYRFRLADPRIFQAYEALWKQPGAGGKFLPLSGNFRSREALLEFINPLFRALMRPVIGGVSYDADAELQFGNRAERLPLSLAAHSQEKVGRVVPPRPLTPSLSPGGREGDRRAGEGESRFMDPIRVAVSIAATHDSTEAERWPKPDEVSPRVELHLIAKASDGDENGNHEESEGESAELLNLQTEEREARLIARRLKQLKASGHRVWDRKQERFKVVEYGDMVVLMRGIGARAEAFAKEFHLAGVPLHAERAGFFDALEVTDLLNLLRLLDNPLQDVPLLAVLRSPLVGLSADELVDVRLAHRNGLMWTALTRWHETQSPRFKVQSSKLKSVVSGQSSVVDGVGTAQLITENGLKTSELSRGNEVHPLTLTLSPSEGERIPEEPVRTSENTFHKVNGFLKGLARWRELIRHASLSQCLEAALAETYYEALLLAGERGPERVANVRRLADLARRFDPYRREGLFRFLRFIDEQTEAEVRHEPATLSSGNAVRLMTIHQSKGQEFPVVVVAGLGNAFNLRDLYGDILLQEDLGLCPKVLPPGGRRRFPSLTHWLAAQRERRAFFGEELRLLYVATTRAQDTLVLTGAASKKASSPRERIGHDAESTSPTDLSRGEPWRDVAPITDFALLKARCYLDWLRLWLPHGTTAADWQNDREGANDLLRWRIYDPLEGVFARPNAGGQQKEVVEAPALPTQVEFATLKARLTWRYSHDAATAAPAKRSVTALARSQVEADEETAPLFQFRVPGSEFQSAPKGAASKMSAAEVGTAHHRFLQLVSLDSVDNLAALEREGDRLCTAQLLSPEEVKALDLAAIARFWQSEVGQKVRANAGLVRREVPFTLRLTREHLVAAALPAAAPEGEYVVLQGVIDLAVLLAGEIWLVDFKTDDLKPSELDEKQQHYVPQLNLYALALETIFCRPVKERWLHFLTLGKTVSV